MFKRDLHQIIVDQCFQGKAIILLGARQVGKTTLLKQIIQEQRTEVQYLCDAVLGICSSDGIVCQLKRPF